MLLESFVIMYRIMMSGSAAKLTGFHLFVEWVFFCMHKSNQEGYICPADHFISYLNNWRIFGDSVEFVQITSLGGCTMEKLFDQIRADIS